jgi:hypothetical protein
MARSSTAGPSRTSALRNSAGPVPDVNPSDAIPDVVPSDPISNVVPIGFSANEPLGPPRLQKWRRIGDVAGYTYYLSPENRVLVRKHRNRQETFSHGPDTPMASEEVTRAQEAVVNPPINELPVRLLTHSSGPVSLPSLISMTSNLTRHDTTG